MLPDRPKSKNSPSVPEFVRNVMGSSAGAGSGEFHVYRHLRRKEYSRQKFIQEKGRKVDEPSSTRPLSLSIRFCSGINRKERFDRCTIKKAITKAIATTEMK